MEEAEEMRWGDGGWSQPATLVGKEQEAREDAV